LYCFLQHRLAVGGALLPARYKRLVIRAQSSLRFEEFDFTYYNKTRFAGLENDLPNCYCNALLQVCSETCVAAACAAGNDCR
jgi:PAB-dependent poly(A)-specific ribonuclease subunit 2